MSTVKTQIQEGLLNLFSSKLRSTLALLGVLVGTASVVAMVLGGELATNEALKQFQTLGTDLFSVSLTESSDSDDEHHQETIKQFTLSEAENVLSADKNILSAAPFAQFYSPVQFNGQDISASALGVTEEFSRIVHIDMEAGRFISDLDGFSLYCVIGHGIAEELKKYSIINPIGKQIQIGKNIFTIIGVAKPWPENSFIYANIDYALLVPIHTSLMLSKYATINNIIMKLSGNANIDEVKLHIENYLQKFAADKKLFFRSAKELINSMAKQSQILTLFLALIGCVSLIVGGIGVMNIMLVSVVERRREIGIRLAVGATPSDIRSLFLIEAIMLSLCGGLLGVIIGILIAYLIALFSHWEFTFFLLPPFIGFTVSAATGVFFGFYPAHQASKLDPINALRTE